MGEEDLFNYETFDILGDGDDSEEGEEDEEDNSDEEEVAE